MHNYQAYVMPELHWQAKNVEPLDSPQTHIDKPSSIPLLNQWQLVKYIWSYWFVQIQQSIFWEFSGILEPQSVTNSHHCLNVDFQQINQLCLCGKLSQMPEIVRRWFTPQCSVISHIQLLLSISNIGEKRSHMKRETGVSAAEPPISTQNGFFPPPRTFLRSWCSWPIHIQCIVFLYHKGAYGLLCYWDDSTQYAVIAVGRK